MLARFSWRSAVVALSAATVSLVAAELWLRERSNVLPRPYALFEARAGGSYRNLPHDELALWRDGRAISLRTNAHGQAGAERELACPPNTRRVAVLGDSFAFGLWASDADHSFVGVAGRELEPDGIELVNFAACGFTYSDHRIVVEEDAQAFGPQVALICTFNGNDFWEEWLGPNRNRVVDGVLVPNVELHRSKVPAELFRVPHDRIVRWSRKPFGRLAVYHAARKLLASEVAACPPPPPLVVDEDFLEPEHFYAFPLWSLRNPPPVVAQATQVATASLEQLLDECRRRGMRPAVVAIPYARQVSVSDLVGDHYDLRLPQRHVEELCRRRGVPYFDLLPELRRAVRKDRDRKLYVDGDTHFNDAGHAFAGERVAKFVADLFGETVARH